MQHVVDRMSDSGTMETNVSDSLPSLWSESRHRHDMGGEQPERVKSGPELKLELQGCDPDNFCLKKYWRILFKLLSIFRMYENVFLYIESL